MLTQALLAAVETGLCQVLSMDGTALARLGRLEGKVIAVECQRPDISLYLLPAADGLRLAGQWQAEADCTLSAPAPRLMQLALAQNKTPVLHAADVDLTGDSALMMEFAAILQDLDLDWEYQLSRWLGPLGSQLLGTNLRHSAQWTQGSLERLRLNLADFLSEESRTLVGQREAQARFDELDQLKLSLDRLEARVARLAGKASHSS
jgi:ubiquinone biosynthesis protein UbiJ